LYTGLDLSGWKAANEEVKKRWKPSDTVLRYDAPVGATIPLGTEKEFGDAEFIVDFRFPAKKDAPCTFTFQKGQPRETKVTLSPSGKFTVASKSTFSGDVVGFKDGSQWNRLYVTFKGDALTVRVNDKFSIGDIISDMPTTGAFELTPAGPMEFANLFVRELK
jgi:hypothetical protein